ncbi:hypothetical protein BKA69DRAFT_59720 [Paraphysoderma sedebokerense]|nr:hypothetical protein BKA69DRAFT_59720 [Paraphysoderma sedebokerense]
MRFSRDSNRILYPYNLEFCQEEAVKKAKERREEVGVDLYNLQQRLAKLQRTLEGSHTSHNTIKSFREKAEANLKETTAKYNLASEKLNVQRTAYESRKSELETTSRTLKQIELFHEELKSKLALTRRTIQKAEEDLIKQELEKKRQDYYIDQLTEQVKRLQERKLTYEAQLLSQQKETKLAHEALQEATMEMDAITFERRQLLHQWKSSLVGMQRRQEILSKERKRFFTR